MARGKRGYGVIWTRGGLWARRGKRGYGVIWGHRGYMGYRGGKEGAIEISDPVMTPWNPRRNVRPGHDPEGE